jgi:phosphatidylglycerophosphate synthase
MPSKDSSVWQEIAEATNDIVTPANVLDLLGFGACIYGIGKLNSWKGIVATAAGFMTDVVDGKVARATNTQSPLGEAVDAAGDKVKLALALRTIWGLRLAPTPLLSAVAIQNAANVALVALDRMRHEEPQLHSSSHGKMAMFLEQWGIGLHVIGSQVSKTHERRGRLIKAAATGVGVVGLTYGIAATVGYARILYEQR